MANPESTGHSNSSRVLVLVYGIVTLYGAACLLAEVGWRYLRLLSVSAAAFLAMATQAPMLIYLWKQLGGDDVGYGLLMTQFGALQLLGNLFSGPYIDRLGAKLWLAISFGAAGASCLLVALAASTWMIYASRLFACLELATLSARTLVSQHTDEKNRARFLGYIGVCLGAGFAVGPVLGGYISAVSLQLTAWVAAGVNMLCVASVLLIPAAQRAEGYKLVTEDLELQPASLHRQPSTDPGISARKSDLQSADSTGSHGSKRRKNELQSMPSTGSEKSSRLPRGSHAASSGESQSLKAKTRSFDAGRASRAGSAALEAHAAELGEAVMSHHHQQQQQQQRLHQQADEVEQEADGEQAAESMLTRLLRTSRLPGVASLLTIKVLVAFGLGVLQTTLTLVLQEHYELDPQGNGLVLSFLGMSFILVQGVVVGPVAKHIATRKVVIGFGWGSVLSFAAAAAAAVKIWMLVAVLPFLICCTLVLETICTAELTKMVPPDSKGTVLALDAALLGGAVMVAPSIGSSLFQLIGFSCLGVSGGAACLIMLALVHSGVLKC